MSKQMVGFVGVGRMGAPMVRRLLNAGFDVSIYDKNEAVTKPLVELGAQRADSPEAVASIAEIVLASLPTPPVVQAVALGPNGIGEGTKIKIFIDVSTTGSTMAIRVAEGLAAKGITAVDAPVSGGIAGAEKGTLAVMVSGPEAIYPTVNPILRTSANFSSSARNPARGRQ